MTDEIMDYGPFMLRQIVDVWKVSETGIRMKDEIMN